MKDKKERLARNPLSGLLGESSPASKPAEPSKVEFNIKPDAESNTSNINNLDTADDESLFIVRSFKIKREYDDLLDRIAFWEHEWKQDVLSQVLALGLAAHTQGKVYEPIPPGKKGK